MAYTVPLADQTADSIFLPLPAGRTEVRWPLERNLVRELMVIAQWRGFGRARQILKADLVRWIAGRVQLEGGGAAAAADVARAEAEEAVQAARRATLAREMEWRAIRRAFRRAPTDCPEHRLLASLRATCFSLARQLNRAETAEAVEALVPQVDALLWNTPSYVVRYPRPDLFMGPSYDLLLRAIRHMQDYASVRREPHLHRRRSRAVCDGAFIRADAVRLLREFAAHILK